MYENAESLDAESIDWVLSLRLDAESHSAAGFEARSMLAGNSWDAIPVDVSRAVGAYAPSGSRAFLYGM